MKGETHATIGLAAAATMVNYDIFPPSFILFGASIIGSLLPDIDHNRASINAKLGITKLFYVALAGLILYYRITPKTIGLALVLLAVGFSRHRAITHSFLALCLLYLGTDSINPELQAGLMIGYFFHLLSDFFTEQGIEFFYPWTKNFRAPVTITTGKWAEKIIAGLFSLILLANIIFLTPTFLQILDPKG